MTVFGVFGVISRAIAILLWRPPCQLALPYPVDCPGITWVIGGPERTRHVLCESTTIIHYLLHTHPYSKSTLRLVVNHRFQKSVLVFSSKALYLCIENLLGVYFRPGNLRKIGF